MGVGPFLILETKKPARNGAGRFFGHRCLNRAQSISAFNVALGRITAAALAGSV